MADKPNNMRRNTGNLFFLILSLLFLFPGMALSQERIRIQFKWLHQYQFAGYYAAIEQGYFAEEGLEVELLERNPRTSHIDDVLEGRAEYGVADAGIMLSHMQGKPVVLLKQIFQHSPQVLLTLKESGIDSPQQLKGARVMVNSEGYSDAAVTALLLEAMGSIDEVEVVPQSYRREDLSEKKVDAMVAYITDQPFWFRENGHEVNILDPRNYGIDFYGDNLFTSERELREHPQRVQKVIRAVLKGWQYAVYHQEEMVDLILHRYNTQGFSRDHLLYEARQTSKMIAPEFHNLGSVNLSRLEKIAETYGELGITEHPHLDPAFIYDERTPGLQLTDEERAYLEGLPVLRVPLIEHQPPLTFSKDGQPMGYLNELFERVAASLGIKYQSVQGLSYGESLGALQSGQVDILNDYSESGQERGYALSTQPVITVPFVAVGRAGSPPVRSVADFRDKRLVLVSGFQQARKIQQDYPHLPLLLVDSIDQAYRALRSHDADYYIDNATHAGFYLRDHMISDLGIAGELPPDDMGLLELRFGISSERPLLHSAVEKALQAIAPKELQALRNRWLFDLAGSKTFTLTAEENKWLSEHPVIRLALDPAWAPIEYVNEQGEFEGMSLDYINRLEALIGVRFEPSPGISWQDVVDGVKNKSLDMFASVSRTPQREEYSLFTRPYVSMPINIFARTDVSYIGSLDNLRGKRVAVVEGYAIHDWLVNDHPELNLQPVGSPQEGLEAVASGDIYAYVGNVVVASFYIGKMQIANVRVSGETPYSNSQSMAVRDDWPLFAGILQKALDAIPDSDRSAIFNRWMSIKYEYATDYTLIWQILILVMLVLALFLYWNRRLAREVDRRKRVEEQIRRSEAQLAVAADVAGMTYWELDIPSMCFTFSDSFFAMMKTTPEREGGYDMHLDRYLTEFCHPDDVHGLLKRFQSLAKLEQPSQGRFEYRTIGRDGERQYGMVDYRVVMGEQESPAKVLGSYINITERRVAERELLLAQAAIERTAEGFVTVGVKDGLILSANKQATIYTNYQKSELVGMPIWELDVNLDKATWPELASQIIKAQNLHFETFTRQKGGYQFPVEISASYLKDENMDQVVVFFKDIIERQKNESLLRESEERFQRSLDFANIGTWDWDVLTGSLHWSDQIAPLFGYQEGELESTYKNFIKAIHPDDRGSIQSAVNACLEGREEFEVEHRVVWPDGTVRWLLERGDVVRDDAGEPLHMLGVVQDITQRKLAQDELQHKSEELADFNETMVDRESRMIELKEEINELNKLLGREVPYPQVWRDQ